MKTISTYILKECTTYTLMSLFTFTGLLLVGRILRLTSLIVNKGVALEHILMVFISIIPTFLELAIPMSVLLGIMMAFTRLSGDSEIIVLRASGVSLFRLLPSIILFGIIASFFSLYISTQLKPWGHKKLSDTLFQIARSKTTSGLSEGFFNKLGKLTLYAEKISPNGDLENVIIDDKRDPEQRKITFAKSGIIGSDESEQSILINLKDGSIHEQNGHDYALTRYQVNSISFRSSELFSDDSNKDKRTTEMTLGELESAYLNSKEKKPLKFLSEWQKRFAMPFASLIFAIIALPLGIVSPRAQKNWGITLCISLGLLIFVIYYGTLSVGTTLAEKGTIPVFLGIWFANFLGLACSIFLVYKICSEKWFSITDAVAELALNIKRRFKK